MNKNKNESYLLTLIWLTLVLASVVVIFTVPINGSSVNFVLNQLAFIVIIAFTIPYAILKIAFHFAHTGREREGELRVRDLPKNAPRPRRTRKHA